MKDGRFQFTMRQMMIAVLVVAGLLALLRTEIGLAIIMSSSPGIAGGLIGWLATRHRRGRAAFCFLGTTLFVNVAGSLACIYAQGEGEAIIWGMLTFWITPIILGFGAAWARAASTSGAKKSWRPPLAWSMVLLLAVLQPTSVFFHWPLRLAFFVSRPALNRLADQVAEGRVIRPPKRAGLFWIVESKIDPKNGNIALFTDTIHGGPSKGLVRLGPDSSTDSDEPKSNSILDVRLDEQWFFQDY